jgi:hypothetical protein
VLDLSSVSLNSQAAIIDRYESFSVVFVVPSTVTVLLFLAKNLLGIANRLALMGMVRRGTMRPDLVAPQP